ncbi:porin family protein [Vibrio sp. ZSDE26]|uniref:Porin family protein n=1 Tax=Vibrio amylolyticus TaxID=2847292 RepID=A0A9X1XL68_9VIBR|nr:outer membrane beta-barrel protein [Vibrio amylolyticus]MCK6263758.1 porin family protein [Vibrio amylolyticus]
MERTIKAAYLTVVIGLILQASTFSPPALANQNSHRLFAETGYSSISGELGSKNAWLTNVGYSYYLSPFIGLDVGYTNIVSDTPQYSNEYLDTIGLSYQGYFGGVQIQHPVKELGTLYAKGGISYTTLEETNLTINPNTVVESSSIQPYYGVGVKFNSIFRPDLDVNVEFIHHDLEGDYSNSSFLVGASFKL